MTDWTTTRCTKVDWRPALTVADARVKEGASAAVEFEVHLGRAASQTVAVDYAMADGTARAGEDYTAARGRLRFEVGESSKTIAVGVLGDAHDEGEETFTLVLSNASGAWLENAEATGTIENADRYRRRCWRASDRGADGGAAAAGNEPALQSTGTWTGGRSEIGSGLGRVAGADRGCCSAGGDADGRRRAGGRVSWRPRRRSRRSSSRPNASAMLTSSRRPQGRGQK